MVNQTQDGSNPRFGFRSEAAGKLAKDRFSFFTIWFSCALILAQIAIILASFKKLPPEIPIFYSRPWGESMLAASWVIWILPAFSFLFLAINYIAARLLIAEFFLYRVLIIFGAICTLGAFYNTVKIITLLV